MMNTKKRNCASRRPVLTRTHRVTFMLNDEEKKILDQYVNKYRIKNVSRFLREAVVRTILRQLDKDRPDLFDQKLD